MRTWTHRGAALTVAAAPLLASLAGAGPAHATFPGRNGLIAFGDGRRVLVVSPKGGASRSLHDGDAPVWSRDGAHIAFIHTDARASRTSLWVMDENGAHARKIADRATSATWSPDGRELAFSALDGGLWVVRIDGGRAREVFRRPGFDVEFPNWSPKGGRIAFTGALLGGNGRYHGLYTISPQGGALHHVLKTNAATSSEWFSWSPDGTRLAYADRSVGGAVAIVDATTGRKRLVKVRRLQPVSVAWSPDGRRFALVAARGDSSAEHLFTLRVDGSDVRPLAGAGVVGEFLDWQRR